MATTIEYKKIQLKSILSVMMNLYHTILEKSLHYQTYLLLNLQLNYQSAYLIVQCLKWKQFVVGKLAERTKIQIVSLHGSWHIINYSHLRFEIWTSIWSWFERFFSFFIVQTSKIQIWYLNDIKFDIVSVVFGSLETMIVFQR